MKNKDILTRDYDQYLKKSPTRESLDQEIEYLNKYFHHLSLKN